MAQSQLTKDQGDTTLTERRQVPPPSDPPSDHNPLLSVIGAFENDPEYDALMEDVYEYRRQLDARESQNAG